MAVDRKADHVGNHGGGYTDIDGMRKQFTYIDHDKKTKVSAAKTEDLAEIKQALRDHAERQVLEILALPAVNALRNPWGLYEEFVIRDTVKGIIWDENAVRDACTINMELGRCLHMQCWKRTVKEQYWFDEMSHEDILAGKWKEWQ